MFSTSSHQLILFSWGSEDPDIDNIEPISSRVLCLAESGSAPSFYCHFPVRENRVVIVSIEGRDFLFSPTAGRTFFSFQYVDKDLILPDTERCSSENLRSYAQIISGNPSLSSEK